MSVARAAGHRVGQRAGARVLLAACLWSGCWQTDLAGVIAPGSGGGSTCAPPASPCGDACALLTQDPGNCGACGQACTGSDVCSESACAPQCAAGLTDCGGACVSGACPCASGYAYCSGVCVDVKVSPHDCGGCGKACPPSKTCVGGACT